MLLLKALLVWFGFALHSKILHTQSINYNWYLLKHQFLLEHHLEGISH